MSNFKTMLNLIKSIIKSNQVDYNFDSIIQEVERIAESGNKLVICPENTGANWLGVKNATKSMFPIETICLPQEYSNQLITDDELLLLLTKFKDAKGEAIILSGLFELLMAFTTSKPKYFDIL